MEVLDCVAAIGCHNDGNEVMIRFVTEIEDQERRYGGCENFGVSHRDTFLVKLGR
jgi:hypothetical protein